MDGDPSTDVLGTCGHHQVLLEHSRGLVVVFSICVFSRSSTDFQVTCPLSRFESWDCDPAREGMRTLKAPRGNHTVSEPRRPLRHWPSACWPRCPSRWLSTTATRNCLRAASVVFKPEGPVPAQHHEGARRGGSEPHVHPQHLLSPQRPPGPSPTPVFCWSGRWPTPQDEEILME